MQGLSRFTAAALQRRLFRLGAVPLLVLLLFACQEPRRKPALPPVPKEAFAKPWEGEKVFLIGIGDSITAGYGATPQHSYFELLARNAPEDGDDIWGCSLSKMWPKLKAVNLAMNYTTSAEHLDDQIGKMADFRPDMTGVVVMTTGGNDIIHDYGKSAPADGAMYGATLEQALPWIAGFQKRLETMLDELNAKFPGGCHVFLANVYDPTDGLGDIENAGLGLPAWKDGLKILTAVNRVISGVVEKRENVHLVDIHDAFLGHGIHCRQQNSPHYRKDDPSYWYFENLEDPNNVGHNAIRRLFLVQMAKVFAAERIIEIEIRPPV